MIEPIFRRVAGLDIHKKIIVVTTLVENDDNYIIEATKEFKTTNEGSNYISGCKTS